MVKVEIDTNGIDEIIKKYKDDCNRIPENVSRAINRCLEMTRTEMIRVAKKKYTVRGNKLRNSINIFKSTKNNLSGAIVSSGKTLGLDHFKLTPKVRVKRRRILKVEIIRGGLKALPHAFIAYKDGRLGAFERTGRFREIVGKRKTIKRETIKRLRTTSAPQMLGNKDTISYLQGYATEKFEQRLIHEIERGLDD